MKVAVINVPIRAEVSGVSTWITVPPQGYGGIQWVVAQLNDALLALGHEVFLLGAPGSVSTDPRLTVVEVAEAGEMRRWLEGAEVDIVHDHSNDVVGLRELSPPRPFISTHHLTGTPRTPFNVVYLSRAQARQAGAGPEAPVVRIPVNPARYIFSAVKQDYLLFIGRLSPWKGALEAAAFAEAAGVPLVAAGPSWEPEYYDEIAGRHGEWVKFVGETSGRERLELLAGARALLAMSQPVLGIWGDRWVEPGATVVSEAAVSGTPVISTDNGCLAEITPLVGRVLPAGEAPTPERARAVLDSLPSADAVRETAVREWGHLKIGREYEALYRDVIGGRQWR